MEGRREVSLLSLSKAKNGRQIFVLSVSGGSEKPTLFENET